MKRTYEVKRVCVSALTEIEREDPLVFSSYPNQSAVGSACKKCQRERTRNRDNKNKHKGRRKPMTRANTPIVIQLEDSIRVAIQQRQKSKEHLLKKQESSETNDEKDETDTSSSDRGDVDTRSLKHTKNFTAFISVMEKLQQKGFNCAKGNFISDKSNNEKKVAEFVLNNAPLSQTSTKQVMKKRSIVECENVDVICNDLNSVESAHDDTEESEIASTTSSSEIQSDSDISNIQEGPVFQDFTPDELKRLAEYTTGCPLIRYECPPSECPQCQWYNNQIIEPESLCHTHNYKVQEKLSHCSSRHNNKSTKPAQKSSHVPSYSYLSENHETSNSDSDIEEITDPENLINNSQELHSDACLYDSCVSDRNGYIRSNQKQLLDIDIASKQKSLYGLHSDQFLDSVYMDLTDSDVSFTVYYHHNLVENQSYTSFSSTYAKYTLSNITGAHHHGPASPYISLPYYHQYLYWPSYYTPICNLTPPFCLPPDEKLPKTLMIPPEELPKCKLFSLLYPYIAVKENDNQTLDMQIR